MVLPGVPGLINVASKTAKYNRYVMRLQKWGCKNRPFYHIVVDKMSHPNRKQIDYLEQVGTYDAMTNAHNEKLIALNLEKIQTYIAGGVQVKQYNKKVYFHSIISKFSSCIKILHILHIFNVFFTFCRYPVQWPNCLV